ncbi:MAG: Heat shock protein 70, partial [Phycisphaerales bacterium]|nr:Heat shock protein 70 [Phycisphaerales bacterium]
MPSTIDYGIDLGTTNSSIACCRGGDVRIFQSNELMNVTPSVVYVSKTGRMLVGRKAYDNWVQDPRNTQAEFKRWMGYNDRLAFPASGKNMSAEELSAEVLKALRADVSRATQEDVRAAVITVPAAFGTLQCDATGRAAGMAGFEQAPLLQEPIAAAIAYGAAPDSRNQRWMVFDLGGGTLDIAIVSTRNGRLAVLEHQGDNRLGGKDIDRLIAEACFFEPLKATFNLPDRLSDPQAYDSLFRALVRHAEQAKIALSSTPQVVVDLFELGDDKDGKPIELSLTLTRGELELKIRPLVDKCLDLATRALNGARLNKSDLDRTLLVGGPTQMPIIRAALEAGIGAKLDTSLDPMTVVARGAALYASTLELTVGPSAAGAPVIPKAVA